MGRSQCTDCEHMLHWYDLVPIISFLLLGGHCHYCGARISWRYPFIEAVTAFLLTLVIIQADPAEWFAIPILVVAIFSLILIAFYDFETQKIPDVFIVVLLLSTLFYQTMLSDSAHPLVLRDAFLGAFIPFAFFGSMWVISRQQWIGSGDILLGIAIGLLLGVKLTLLALFFAYIMGAVAAILLIALRLVQKGSTLAFGPFLASGALLSLFVGEAFLVQYQHLFF